MKGIAVRSKALVVVKFYFSIWDKITQNKQTKPFYIIGVGGEKICLFPLINNETWQFIWKHVFDES